MLDIVKISEYMIFVLYFIFNLYRYMILMEKLFIFYFFLLFFEYNKIICEIFYILLLFVIDGEYIIVIEMIFVEFFIIRCYVL